jgi:serine phosphatase RsbU (regulator of sigma subunit)
MSFDYLVMGLVVIFTAGGGFLSANAMLGYYLMCILLTGATVVAKPDMQHLTFFWGIVTALIISYLGLKSLLGLFRDLRTSKAALQKRTDEFTALSSAVQTLFLPDKEEWKTDQWHVAGFYRPADGCGGDWWSYSEHDHKLSIVIGDVTGHGPGPAMMTASIASYMRALQNERPDLAMGDLLRALNRHLMDLHGGRHSEQHYLMTVHAIEVDPLSKQIHSWSAGAPSAAIFNPNHETRFLGSRGAPLGVEAHLQLGSDSAPLHSGDRILLYTDGISEMKCGDRILGDRRLLKIATNDLHLSPLAATRSLVGQLDRLRGATEQDDDYTLVVLDVA